MIVLSFCLIFLGCNIAWADDIDLRNNPSYLKLAWGKLNKETDYRKYPWPLNNLSIGHSLSSYQKYEYSWWHTRCYNRRRGYNSAVSYR